MKINRKWIVICVIALSFIGYGNSVSASSKKEITTLYAENEDEGSVLTDDFKLERNGKIQFSFSDETYGDITVRLYDATGTQVYTKSFYAVFDSVTYTTGELNAGSYSVSVEAESFLTDYDLTIYAIFEASMDYPEFEADTSKITLEKGETEELEVDCEPEDAKYSIRWYSDNPRIASVSNTGVIKAKKKGSTTVYAKISTPKNSNYETFKWKVVVNNPNPSFAKVSQKMKGFKQSKTMYIVKQKGKKAVLLGGSNTLSWGKHIKTQGYGHLGRFYPYVELVKKNGETSISLKFYSWVKMLTIDSSDYLEYDEIVFKGGSTALRFSYSNSKEKSKTRKGVTTITNKATVNLSSNKNDNLSKVNKLIKILKKKKVIFKAKNTDEGGYVQYSLNKKTKKNWIKFIKNYKKLLELY